MNLLFVTEIAPFPINGGEKLRSYGLLKMMSDLNLNVQAIIGKSSSKELLNKHLKGIAFHEYDFQKRLHCGRLQKYYRLFSMDKELLACIDKILENNTIDIVYIDYHLYGQYIGYFKKKKFPVIYGTHNAQAKLIYQRPAVSLTHRVRLFIDYLAHRIHEWYFFRKADALIVVSEEDKKYHQAFIPKDKIFVIPNFLIDSEYQVLSPEKENYVLMTANFEAFQNRFGLEWFIREVWDQEIQKITRLKLAGFYSDKVFASLKEKYDMTHIEAMGEAEDLKPYIVRAKASIVPLLHGSGSRLKCIESMAMKTQLISTSRGAEGIDHDQSILIADEPSDFRNKLLAVLRGEINLTEKAHNAYLRKYSLEPNKTIFRTIIHNISGS